MKQARVEQVADLHAGAAHLVHVAGTDAPAGGADLLFPGQRGLAGLVETLVIGHDQVGVAADKQLFRRNGESPAGEIGHFREQHTRVDDHAVADHAGLVRVEYARGYDVEDVLLAVDHQGMTGVVAALEADHVIRVPRQQIDDLALALVTPLGADHHHTGHVLSLIA